MTQKNIDFGSFPDDPDADAIRLAFQKTQDNFTELYAGLNGSAVFSVNKTPGAGVTVNFPTGNVVVSANIARIGVRSTSLGLGIGSLTGTSPSANLISSSQTLVVDLLPTTTIGNLVLTGYANVTGNITGGNLISSGSLSVTGNANVGNLGSTGIVTAVGNVIGGNLTTVGMISAIGNANVGNINAVNGVLTGTLGVTSNISGGNLTTTGVVTATGNVSGGNLTTTGVVTATGNVSGGNLTTTGNIAATGNITGAYILGNGAFLTGVTGGGGGSGDKISNGTSNVSTAILDGNVTVGVSGNANILVITGTGANLTGTLNVTGNSNVANLSATGNVSAGNLNSTGVLTVTGNANVANINAGNGVITSNLGVAGTASLPTITSNAVNGNITLVTNGTGIVVLTGVSGGAVGIEMGIPTQGALLSNAVALTTSTSITNGIAQLNKVLGKLVPPTPPAFPNSTTLAIQSLSTYRMTTVGQSDRTPGANKAVAAGTTVSTVRRVATYTTNTISTCGPGDSGTVTCMLNGANAGGVVLTGANNGTYGNLIISLNQDYNSSNVSIPAGFWYVFSTALSGTVLSGWNEVYISDTAASSTNTANWYYDASAPGTPVFSSVSITEPGAPVYQYSSTVPHYTNTNAFIVSALVNKLSGDMYPTTDTFVTGTAGGAFGAPTSVTYAAASVTTPLAQNLYVSSGNATIAGCTATIISGFGGSSANCSLSCNNSYNTGTGNVNPGATILYKTGTASTMEEANVVIGSTIGSGTGLAYRIINPGSINTPAFTASAAAFNSQSSTLQTYDATIVAAVLKHDQTNYSTGYKPVGPNLSTGRSGTQYFTFKFIRSSTSKFDIKYSGNIAGMWVALPGSVIDSSSTANGWMDMTVSYAGAGYPGVNGPGNGSNGCALGGIVAVNVTQTNYARTCTFGTVSSSSTGTNEIYVRIALTAGQTVTALSLQTASN